MVKWRGMPMMRCVTRQKVRGGCGECGVEIPPKAEAFRPMLDSQVNGVQRYHRICLVCAISVGTDGRYAGGK